jgi:spermidine synthase
MEPSAVLFAASALASCAIICRTVKVERAVVFAVALSGSAALIYEVAATQALLYFLNSSSYSVSTAISSFLAGLAVGSIMAYKWLPRIKDGRNTLAALQLAAGAYALVVLRNYGILYPVVTYAYPIIGGGAAFVAAKFAIAFAYLVVPTALLGASFPLAASIMMKSGKEPGRDVARVYSWDLFGAIAGSLLAGFIILPVYGISSAFAFGAALNLLAGAFAAEGRIRYAAAAIAVLAAASVFLTAPHDGGFAVEPLTASPHPVGGKDVLYERNTPYGTVSVVKIADGNQLTINGVVQCNKNYINHEANLKRFIGYLPENISALDIGLGCGYSSKAMLSSGKARRLKVVEINPAVSEALPYFGNGDIISDPRVEIVEDSILNHLALDQEKYDFINLDLDTPALIYVSPMYTTEYFTLLSARLRENGSVRVWVCCGDYEYAKTFYRTLDVAFDNITLKTAVIERKGETELSGTEFIASPTISIPQTEDERNMQERILADPEYELSTLDRPILGRIWYGWSQRVYPGYFNYTPANTPGAPITI